MVRPASNLLDVVPWAFGFAHAFALSWLLREPNVSSLILRAAEDFPLPADAPVSCVETERAGGRGRADIRFELEVAPGERRRVPVEIKVNDPVDPEQLSAYGSDVILYTPGLTGLLISTGHADLPAAAQLTGAGLAGALEAHQDKLPDLIAGYVDAVGDEAARMERARAVALDRAQISSVGERDGRPNPADLVAVAWVAEVAAALDSALGNVTIRVTRNDRGLKWDVGGQYAHDSGSWLWIDVLVTIATRRREIRVKANGPARRQIYSAARAEDLPPGEGWVWSPRTLKSQTSSIAAIDVSHSSLSEALVTTAAAAGWTQRLARGA